MTDYYTQVTISPCLPAALFSDEEIASMEYAFGLTCERTGRELYFFAETIFTELGEDEEGEDIDLIELLQRKLRQMDQNEYPHITIQGCTSCGKMRPDEFGGFAYFITRDDQRHIATRSWLDAQSAQATATLRENDQPVEIVATATPPSRNERVSGTHPPTTPGDFNAPWNLRFEQDGTEDVAVIFDSDGDELVRSRHFWLPAAGDPQPPTLAAMQLIANAPVLLEALYQALNALNTAPRFRVDDTDSYNIAAFVSRTVQRATSVCPLHTSNHPETDASKEA